FGQRCCVGAAGVSEGLEECGWGAEDRRSVMRLGKRRFQKDRSAGWAPSQSTRRFSCALYLFPRVPSVPLLFRLAVRPSYLRVLKHPSPPGLVEFHPDGKAVALHRLAVSHSCRGTKLSGT